MSPATVDRVEVLRRQHVSRKRSNFRGPAKLDFPFSTCSPLSPLVPRQPERTSGEPVPAKCCSHVRSRRLRVTFEAASFLCTTHTFPFNINVNCSFKPAHSKKFDYSTHSNNATQKTYITQETNQFHSNPSHATAFPNSNTTRTKLTTTRVQSAKTRSDRNQSNREFSENSEQEQPELTGCRRDRRPRERSAWHGETQSASHAECARRRESSEHSEEEDRGGARGLENGETEESKRRGTHVVRCTPRCHGVRCVGFIY